MVRFPIPEIPSRTAQVWLSELKQAKEECLAGQALKLTVADVVERANDAAHSAGLDPTSPRSVDAFLRRGVEPLEIRQIHAADYKRLTNPALFDLADYAYHFQENLRQERIKAVQDERKYLLDGGDIAPKKRTPRGPAIEVAGVDVGDMVEKEAKRLEVTRRRQARELGQMVSYEVARKEQQDKAEAKLRALEVKAEEQRKARVIADAQWQQQQRQRELKRLREDQEREQEARTLEAARYQKELEMSLRDQEAEKQRRRAGFRAEQERIQRAEMARRETERILAEQEAELERKKADMLKRDQTREAAKAERAEQVRLRNEAARQKAATRMQATLNANRSILKQRRAEYDKQQADNERRRKEKEAVRAAAEAEARRHEAEAERQRQDAYRAAQERELARVEGILSKSMAKTQSLEMTYTQREHENSRLALMRQLELNLKRQKVEEMRRRQLYQRDLLLQRIENETQKTFQMKTSRADLQEQRRAANMHASFERQQLMQSIEKLQASKKLGQMVGGGSQVDISSLLATMR